MQGNACFKSKNFIDARRSYRKAVWALESMKFADEKEEDEAHELLFKIHNNLAQVALELKEYAKACSECKCALQTHSKKVKNDTKGKLFFRLVNVKAARGPHPGVLTSEKGGCT